ncbi:BnaC03g16650D [Brassica napus]|uniref:BnaC03g16650D protein n=1 Tax=Brassica napus TaxID=3708 RepID=A0A078GF93_BRANA|nr:BnaC03g16650D [Brassica napus]
MDPTESHLLRFRHVVAMPWPGRGHINPMMNLCKRLVLRDPNLTVTFVVTEEWLGLIGSDPKPDRIHFATLPNLIPSELVRANDFIGFVNAVHATLEEPFEQLLDRLDSPPPTAIVADTYVLWAVRVGERRNIPVASLWTMSATILSLFLHSDLLISHGHALFEPSESKEEEIVDYIPGLPPTKLRDLPPLFKDYQVFKKCELCFDELRRAKCLLFTTAYELERKAIDFLTAKLDIPVYATGPLIPFEKLSDGSEPDYIRWLDEQPESSVLYVSQGSFLSVSEAQMDEIVEGVRASGVRFLWVARGGESKLNKAFEGSSGVVVSWCDQLRVLCHVAVGGFWTHCGFNSTLEGMYSGVPMLAFPLFWDQILNGKMIVEDWRVGIRIERRKKAEVLIGRDEVKEVVKRLMDRESEDGKEIRRRACDLSEICRGAVEEMGQGKISTCGRWGVLPSFGRKTLYHDLLLAENNRRDKIVKAYICMRGDERTQPSPVTVSDNIKAKIALQLENFVRRNFSKTQSIRVPAAAQLMPNKTIIA